VTCEPILALHNCSTCDLYSQVCTPSKFDYLFMRVPYTAAARLAVEQRC